MPVQDTPSRRLTYAAAVRVPEGLTALMSALPDDGAEGGGAELAHLPPRVGARVFRFRQPLPIPSYLLALAVGGLASRELGPVSRVWAEPPVADAAAHEFADTPRYLAAAEEIAGPYRWGRYDLLVLPPSFPYGGMENPQITFVTPTLLAGDRSLATVVAHEIAHSWSGNLVTNASWRDFWLNEGWTVWLERKIVGRLEGEPARQLAAALGAQALREAVREWGVDHPFTALVLPLEAGVDPDDAYRWVAANIKYK